MNADPDHVVDVAIVGYWPTGAVLANILGAAGLRTVVFDREPAPLDLPRAVHFDGEVMRVFQSIGLAQEISGVIRLSRGVRYYSGDGELLMERPPPTSVGRHSWADKYMFHQPDLERVLRDGVGRYGCVDVRLRHEVLDVVDAADGAMLSVKDLRSDSASMWRAKWVVGADGGRSLVRESIGTTLEDLGVHSPWLVVDVEVDDDTDLPDCTVQYCDPGRPVTYVNVTGPRRRWELMLLPTDDPDEISRPESVWKLISPWVTPRSAHLVRSARYTFHALLAEQWSDGHLLLAGDSAHQTPPFLGQGMCTGIRDAANLGWKLTAVVRGADEGLLDTYQSERRPHARTFIETAATLGAIIQTTDPVEAAARDAEMLAGGTVEFVDPTPSLGPGLHTGGDLGGHILDQPRLSDGRLLDDVIGPRFGVVAKRSTNPDSDTRSKLEALDVALLIDDALDAWLARLGVEFVMLRPDRYVFGTAVDGAELTKLIESLSAAIVEQTTLPA